MVRLLASGTKGMERGKEWSPGLLKEQGGVYTREREQEKAATRWRSAARGGDALRRIEAEGDGSYVTQSESPTPAGDKRRGQPRAQALECAACGDGDQAAASS